MTSNLGCVLYLGKQLTQDKAVYMGRRGMFFLPTFVVFVTINSIDIASYPCANAFFAPDFTAVKSHRCLILPTVKLKGVWFYPCKAQPTREPQKNYFTLFLPGTGPTRGLKKIIFLKSPPDCWKNHIFSALQRRLEKNDCAWFTRDVDGVDRYKHNGSWQEKHSASAHVSSVILR